jgi:hypothetical protein
MVAGMLVRPALLRFVAAALLAPAVAWAAEEPGKLTSTTAPAPPLGVLSASPDRLPTQGQLSAGNTTSARPPARRLSPSEIYAREHARRAPAVPSFATVRPPMRKPLPGEGPDNAKEAKAPAPKPAAPATKAAAPAIDGFFAEKAEAKAPAAKPKVVKKTTPTKPVTTAAVSATATPAAIPELIVRPATPAAIYERAAKQYRSLRSRDLEMVRHLLPPQQYEDKRAAIDASYHPQ